MNIITSNAIYDVELGTNPTNDKPWLGVYVEQPLASPNLATNIILWFQDLIFWLYVLSLGVGLFNLVPLGPIDGGRMLLTALEGFIHEKKANRIWKSVSFVVLGVLLTNVVLAFV